MTLPSLWLVGCCYCDTTFSVVAHDRESLPDYCETCDISDKGLPY